MQQNIEFERCIDFLVRMIDTKCKSDCRFFHVFLNQINFKS